MTTSLSLYSSKILAEHPLGHWPLLDRADYVSAVTDSQSNMTAWTATPNDVSVEYTSTLTTPMPDKPVFKVTTHNLGISNIKTVKMTSNTISSFESFDEFLSTFTLSTFFYSSAENMQGIFMGLEYVDPTYGLTSIRKRFQMPVSGKWTFLSETFDRPYDLTANFKIFFEFEFLSNASTDEVFFLFNGLSLGQWSEEFNSESTGVIPETIIENIYGLGTSAKGIKMFGSAESTKDGYSLCNGNSILARNSGIPMVYGAKSSITLLPNNNNKPSLVLPGLGFLNDSGKNRKYTFEAWIKIDHLVDSDFRIIGPVSSLDGIYINGSFIKLKIGNYTCSHYLGELYRPMLLHVAISSNKAIMMINGEVVGEIDIDLNSISLPKETVSGVEHDWIGFYSNNDVSLFELGPVSLYTYIVSGVIAKRRWVYGQGVENPESLNVAYGGKSVAIDYQFSKYANNYSYPKSAPWSRGISNNLMVDTDYLKLPKYSGVSIVSANSTESTILQNIFPIQNEDSVFIRLPENSYIFSEKFDMLQDGVSSFYIVFKEPNVI
jgi:hypothetical protein